MRSFEVLERDVVVEDLALLAAAAGFGETLVGIYSGIPFLVPAESFTDHLANGAVAQSAVQAFHENHRLVVLTKPGRGRQTSRSPDGLAAELNVEPVGPFRFTAVIRKAGAATWLGRNVAIGTVNLGVQLRDVDGRTRDLDYLRVPLRSDPEAVVEPGDVVRVDLDVPDPSLRPYRLSFDLVSERVAWFRDIGATPLLQSDVTI